MGYVQPFIDDATDELMCGVVFTIDAVDTQSDDELAVTFTDGVTEFSFII